MGLISFPLALAATAAIPALAAIYLLRSRYRRQVVSSLMLWSSHRSSQGGGRKLHRLQTPLLFFLELLVLILLIVAAAGPQWTVSVNKTPLIVILDDSYSMLANGDQSPRNQAIEMIQQLFVDTDQYETRFVLAGSEPQLLGDLQQNDVKTQTKIEKAWQCFSPFTDIDQAIALAIQLVGPRGHIAVMTDQPPPQPYHTDRVRWWAFGTPIANAAIIHATRSKQENKQRCLIEVANFSVQPRQVLLRVTEAATSRPIESHRLNLAAKQIQRLFIDLPVGTGAIIAAIQDDALPIDNRVILLPPSDRHVHVGVRIQNNALRQLIVHAIEATQRASWTQFPEGFKSDPHESFQLIMTDGSIEPTLPNQTRMGQREEPWWVQWHVDEQTTPFVGPFLMDRTHPLTQGLALNGTVWAAKSRDHTMGQPIIAAGQVPLVTDTPRRRGQHNIRIYYEPSRSTLHASANFPVLVWNLLQWRSLSLPGVDPVNVRLGSSVKLTLPTNQPTVRLIGPDQTSTQWPVVDGHVTITGQPPGVWRVETPDKIYSFVCNALSEEESDLSNAATDQVGQWIDHDTLQTQQAGLAWIALVMALAVLCLHTMVLTGDRSR